MLYSLASLDENELEAVQNLERKLGKRVLAIRPLKIEFDKLSENDIAEIQMLEAELGLVLVAVR